LFAATTLPPKPAVLPPSLTQGGLFNAKANPKPPLCKGRWLSISETGGVVVLLRWAALPFVCCDNPPAKTCGFATLPYTGRAFEVKPFLFKQKNNALPGEKEGVGSALFKRNSP